MSDVLMVINILVVILSTIFLVICLRRISVRLKSRREQKDISANSKVNYIDLVFGGIRPKKDELCYLYSILNDKLNNSRIFAFKWITFFWSIQSLLLLALATILYNSNIQLEDEIISFKYILGCLVISVFGAIISEYASNITIKNAIEITSAKEHILNIETLLNYKISNTNIGKIHEGHKSIHLTNEYNIFNLISIFWLFLFVESFVFFIYQLTPLWLLASQLLGLSLLVIMISDIVMNRSSKHDIITKKDIII